MSLSKAETKARLEQLANGGLLRRSANLDGGDHEMKTALTRAALAATMLVAFAPSVQAAPAQTSATAKARVLKQLTISRNADLDFGTIVHGAAASTVIVNSAGAATCGAGLTCTGSTSAADFTVTGTNNTIVTVSAPATVTLTNGATGSMTASLAAPATLALGNSGSTGTPLRFGGTLNVGASQEDGAYSATFNVSVDYQ